jgi:hypothetical protein
LVPLKHGVILGVFTIADNTHVNLTCDFPADTLTLRMAVVRIITCVRKRNSYFDPHEIIESVGGEYLGAPWRLPEYMVIYHIKKGIEKYFVESGKQKLKVIVATHSNREYLKSETDGYSPDSLLTLPECDMLKVVK